MKSMILKGFYRSDVQIWADYLDQGQGPNIALSLIYIVDTLLNSLSF